MPYPAAKKSLWVRLLAGLCAVAVLALVPSTKHLLLIPLMLCFGFTFAFVAITGRDWTWKRGPKA